MKISTNIHNLQKYKIYLSIVQNIENNLQKKGYLKLDLPVLSPALIPENYLEVFKTEYRCLNISEELFLTPSPELFIKRLLSEGIGDCYYIGKSFRNSVPNSSKHQFEFTMLEFYKVKQDYKYMAKEMLDILSNLSYQLFGQNNITHEGKKISFEKWEEMTLAESFERYAYISPDELYNPDNFLSKVKKKGYVTDGFSFEDLWSQVYAQEIEHHLGTHGYPTIIYDYPVQFSSTSKPNNDGKTAQRFEFYIEGVEIGNCYSELTDPVLQKRRFFVDNEDRIRSDKIKHSIDWDFIKALEKGLPQSTGIAVGVERLSMIFSHASCLNDIKLIKIT